MTMRLDSFPLDAEISVTELRQENLVDDRLRTFDRLRVSRRNDYLGVLVKAESWRALAIYVHELERLVELHEGDAVRRILAERLDGADFVAATPEVVADIEREYRRLAGE